MDTKSYFFEKTKKVKNITFLLIPISPFRGTDISLVSIAILRNSLVEVGESSKKTSTVREMNIEIGEISRRIKKKSLKSL